MTLRFQFGVPLRGAAVVYLALAMPRSRPFGLPSHTPARSACPPVQIHELRWLGEDKIVVVGTYGAVGLKRMI